MIFIWDNEQEYSAHEITFYDLGSFTAAEAEAALEGRGKILGVVENVEWRDPSALYPLAVRFAEDFEWSEDADTKILSLRKPCMEAVLKLIEKQIEEYNESSKIWFQTTPDAKKLELHKAYNDARREHVAALRRGETRTHGVCATCGGPYKFSNAPGHRHHCQFVAK